MNISKLKVLNFRCLHEVELPFYKITTLVGRNGTGKSSILKAIDIFYDLNYAVTIDDFCNEITVEPIEITITFTDFSQQERLLFGNFISDDELIVIKRIEWNNGVPDQKYYGKSMRIQDFAEIGEILGLRDQQTAIRELINSGRFENLEGTFRSASDGLAILKQYEEEHPELTELIESRFQFMGARNVGGGSLDNFTRFVLVPAVKEVTEEIEGRGSPISQLINAIVSTEIETREDLVEFTENINRQIREVYSPENLVGLDDLAADISNVLQMYAPNSELKIRWGETSPIQVSLPPILYSLVEDNYEGDISHKGHGLQRALILTLLEYMARIPPEMEGVERPRVDIILALEEPEIYLHPSRCRYLASLLNDLSERGRDDPNQNRVQIIYSTHSPYFVGLDTFDSIRILRKTIDEDQGIPITSCSYYTLEDAAEDYSQICGRSREAISRESFRIQTVPIMKPLTNEGFFADLIVLVEGPSDIGVLWKLQDIMNKEWEKQAIVLIPVGGKQQLIKAGVIFKGIGIPTFIVFDLDADDLPATNRVLQLLGEAPGYPEEFIHDTWACHEINLESTLQEAVGEEDYQRIWTEVGSDFQCNSNRLKKNEEGTSKFTEIVYELEFRLEHCENIVESISNFFSQLNI